MTSKPNTETCYYCGIDLFENPLHDESECPEFDDSEPMPSFQELIDTGMAWKLEGHIGRQCMAAIDAGIAVLGPVGHHDYYGNYVPSRDEVQPGTKGSIEYAQERGWKAPE